MFVNNNELLFSFHHYGLAVNDFQKALSFYKQLGYNCTELVVDLLQNVELIFCTSINYPSVELIKPLNDKSPVINLLQKYNEIIYHVCYEVDNVENIKILFPNHRGICTSKPKPAILFDSRLVAFYYIEGVGLIELLQK